MYTQVGVGFDIVTEEIFNNRIGKDKKKSEDIPNATLYLDSQAPVKQPPYMFGATQVDFWLEGSIDTEYYIVPSVKNRKQAGTYFVHVCSLLRVRRLFMNFMLLDIL